MLTREFEGIRIDRDSVTGGYLVTIKGTNRDGGRTSVVVANTDTEEEAQRFKRGLFQQFDNWTG